MMFLTPDEIIALTARKRASAQQRALNAMGIDHRIRPDGTVLVLRSHVEQSLGGNIVQAKRQRIEPNWNAV